jgi:DNA-binding MarR family transcriptional regulator
MMVINTSSPFGRRARTRTLLALHLMQESYARELARLLDLSLSGVQKALESLERDGLVAERARERTARTRRRSELKG